MDSQCDSPGCRRALGGIWWKARWKNSKNKSRYEVLKAKYIKSILFT